MKIYPLFSVILLFLASFSASAGLYRWVDAKGNVFYADKIPPKVAKLGYVELNYSGIKKKTALSAKQKKAIADLKIKEKKERKEKREKKIKAALKKMQDEQLLSIYSTRKELISVYESKIKMSASSILLLKKRHKVLSERLAKTEIKYEKMKNPKFKETLEGKVNDMLDGLKVYQQAITENMVEKDKLEKQYAINLKRFDNLFEEDKPSKKSTDVLESGSKLDKIALELEAIKKLAFAKKVKSSEEVSAKKIDVKKDDNLKNKK